MPFEWEGCRRSITFERALEYVREYATETVGRLETPYFSSFQRVK